MAEALNGATLAITAATYNDPIDLATIPAAPAWTAEANCITVDPEVMFPEPGIGWDNARAVCDGCPMSVAKKCLDWQNEFEGDAPASVRFGMYGGKTPAERARMCRKEPETNDKCGTSAGYQQHRSNGEKACRPCLDALSAYNRQWAKRKAGAA